MLLFGWFPQMRNRDSMLNALNGHSDHGRIEIKKILPKISFTLSLQMHSKLLLLSQCYTFRSNQHQRTGQQNISNSTMEVLRADEFAHDEASRDLVEGFPWT
ncbi:hypothetical protein ERO13_D13G241601v2 [Gossypium hirsutum]|nr:hypothetical protein ERO13_D13G241601v2 [Gossypium hirsutum]